MKFLYEAPKTFNSLGLKIKFKKCKTYAVVVDDQTETYTTEQYHFQADWIWPDGPLIS